MPPPQLKGAAMNTNELKKYFNEHLVPGRLYILKGSRRGRICMDRSREGWEIYFLEHGQKIGLMRFSTESEACLRMKEEICKLMEALYGLRFISPQR